METIPYHPLIEVTQEQMGQVREFYGINDVKKIRESLDSIEEWCKKQDHLADALPYLSRNMMERLFVLARGSVEGTKTKIDKFLTYRGMMPDLCLHKTVDEFLKLSLNYIPLPKLNPSDNSRVMVSYLATDNVDDLSTLSSLRYAFMVGEYRLNFDYFTSERFIVDLANCKASFITKLNPVLLKKGEILCTEGFGTKIKGVHFLNAPSFVDKIIFIVKQAFKEKVARRLHVHSSYEDLQKNVAKEILPKDFNGDGPSLSELAELWKETLSTEKARKLIKDSDKLVSDESKRSSFKFNEEYLGIPGSFKKLDVD